MTENVFFIQTQEDERCYIQSVYRRDRSVRLGKASYGNLLKVQSGTEEDTEINVKFTGSRFSDPTTGIQSFFHAFKK